MATAPEQHANSSQERQGFYSRMLPAAVAGMIGAAATVAVSLPLRSPDDLFANATSVAVVSVSGAAVLGLVWAFLGRFAQTRQLTAFAIFNVVAFATTVFAAIIVERMEDLSYVASFIAPLAAVMLATTTVATPIVQRYVPSNSMGYAMPILGIALMMAGGLLTFNEVGFNEPPSLSLPPPP